MLAAEMERVDATILERMDSKVPLIPQLAGHLIASGGKRMRPMMTIAGAMLGSDDAAARAPAVKLATAVEFIHSATLLHDDVIDESKLRRGRDTANALWGNDAAVLVGDFLFARAFELMVEAGDMTVLGRLAAAAARITEGEIMQMAITGRPDTTEADYFDVIEGKTAVLFSAAAAAGIEITGAGAAHVEALRVYGMKLGMAFQIMDDALDYTASAAEMGKNAGDDFADQKITLPAIIASRTAMPRNAPSGSARSAMPPSPTATWQRRRRFWRNMTPSRARSPSPAVSPKRRHRRWPPSWTRRAPRRWRPRLPTPPASPPPAAARYRTPP